MSDFEKYNFPKADSSDDRENEHQDLGAHHDSEIEDYDYLDDYLDDFDDYDDDLIYSEQEATEDKQPDLAEDSKEVHANLESTHQETQSLENKAQSAAEPEVSPRIAEGTTLLAVKNINKIYQNQANETLHILNNIDLRLYSGEIAALIGPSGSGKSTLLQILGLLDTPTSGQIIINGRNITKVSEQERTRLRNQYIGFVYQFHHLLPEFTALENVAMPQIIGGIKEKQAHEKAAYLLDILGLGHRIEHRPATLSGGEQQRVAIARALINEPLLLFADEPTGNLDPETSEEVFEILMDAVRNLGIGALIATHNHDLANQMDRILEVKAGKILPF